MNRTEPAWVEPQMPHPPRWRAAKRWAAAYAIVAVGFVSLYAAWVAHARGRWEQGLAAIGHRGEPATHDDLVFEPIPAGQDAAPMLIRAAKGVDDALSDRRLPYEIQEGGRPASDEQRRIIGAIIETHAAHLKLVRDVGGRPRADWGIRFRPPLISVLLPHLRGQRELGRFLLVAAVHAHGAGDDAEAVQLMRDILYVSGALQDGPYVPVSHQVAQAIATFPGQFLEQHASSMHLTDDAARDGARALIAELLDERRSHDGWRSAWLHERLLVHDLLDSHLRGKWPEPVWRLDVLRRMEILAPVIGATSLPTYAQAKPLIPPLLPRWNVDGRDVPEWRRPFATVYPPRMKRFTGFVSDLHLDAQRRFSDEFHFRLQRRVAAVRLACRLHELDTGGLPERWDELVPAYLSHAPADPFAPPGRPLRLAPRDGGGLMVYSVGIDGIDQGGDESRTPDPNRSDRKSHIGDAAPPRKPHFRDRRDIAFVIERGSDKSKARPHD